LYQDSLYFVELIYQTGLTNQDLANKMKELQIPRQQKIVADSAEPKSIEELHRMGFNIHPSFKGKDSINLGIDIMRRHKLRAHKNSLNLIKEFRNYKWQQDKNGKILNEPVKLFDHLMDACRYLILDRLSRPNVGRYAVR
jgi:phage terminase large subunit